MQNFKIETSYREKLCLQKLRATFLQFYTQKMQKNSKSSSRRKIDKSVVSLVRGMAVTTWSGKVPFSEHFEILFLLTPPSIHACER